MRFLFVKQELLYPRRSGHDVHCHAMMRALCEAGHEVGLLTGQPISEAAVEGLSLYSRSHFAQHDEGAAAIPLTRLQEKFRGYWGISPQRIAMVAAAAAEQNADVVVVVGLDVLPYLAGVRDAVRVWYAADEWFLHHTSQMFLSRPSSWSEWKPAVIKGLYERAYRGCVDRVWVVSQPDAKAARWVMGARAVDVAPNGVDAQHYAPRAASDVIPHSCVFWGRLDFGPNIDALRWFGSRVWPQLKRQVPDAVFTVYGFEPTEAVLQMADKAGFQVIANLPDIRDEIARHQAVVLPFVSGAGIKNKLLEAASLAMPIVASRRTAQGLRGLDRAPLLLADRPEQWSKQLRQLWSDSAHRTRVGQTARDWVETEYSWSQAAQTVLAPLTKAVQQAPE